MLLSAASCQSEKMSVVSGSRPIARTNAAGGYVRWYCRGGALKRVFRCERGV